MGAARSPTTLEAHAAIGKVEEISYSLMIVPGCRKVAWEGIRVRYEW